METELERLIVRLIGDATSYQRMMDDAQRASEQTARQVESAAQRVEAFGVSMQRFGRALASALASTGLTASINFAVHSLERIERINVQTATAINSMGGASNVTAEHVNELANSLEDLTASEQESIQMGANMLLTFGEIKNRAGEGNDVFDRTVKAMVDLSRATDQTGNPMHSMHGTAMQLGRALQDPVRGLYNLRRAGIIFSEEQKNTIKNMVDMGDLLGAQKIILKQVEKQYGESGKAFANTTSGQLALAKHAFGTFSESIMSGALPLIKEVSNLTAKALNDAAKWFDGLGTGAKTTIFILASAIPVMLGLVTAITIFGMVSKTAFMSAGLITIVLTAAAIAASIWIEQAGGINNALNQMQGGVSYVSDAWDYLKNTVTDLFEVAAPYVKAFIGGFLAVWLAMVFGAIAAWELLKPAIDLVVQAVSYASDTVGSFINVNSNLATTISIVVGVVTALYLAYQLLLFVYSLLHIRQIMVAASIVALNAALIAVRVATVAYQIALGITTALTWLWKAAVFGAWVVLLVFYTALFLVATLFGLFDLYTIASTIGMGLWGAAVGIANAMTWLWNASLTVLNGLLAGAAIIAAAAILVVIGAAIYAAYQSADLLVRALMSLPTTYGPIGHIAGLFAEWYNIIKDVIEAAKTDMPKAWQLLQAGFKLAISQIRDLWPPLWVFIQGGFSSLWDAVTKIFMRSFDFAMAYASAQVEMALLELQKMDQITDAGKARVQARIDNIQKTLDNARKENANAAEIDLAQINKRLEQLAKNFGVAESAETKAARAEVQRIQKEIADAVKAGPPAAAQAGKTGGEEMGDEFNKGLARELGKIDAVLTGSAEAISRMAAFRDLIDEPLSPRHKNTGLPGGRAQPLGGPIAQGENNKAEKLLADIRDILRGQKPVEVMQVDLA